MSKVAAAVLAVFMALSPARAASSVPGPEILASARARSALEPKLPRWLPEGYAFESFAVMPQGSKKIIHWRYSDGSHALSFFQGPARVRWRFGARPAQRTKLGSGWALWAATPEGMILSWSAPGARFFMVGGLSLDELKRAALSVE